MRKIPLLFLLTLVLASSVYGQRSFSGLAQDRLIRTLDDVLYVVRQEYALRGPDNQLYGANSQDFYNFAYGPAIMWNGNLIVSRFTYQPYLRDTSFLTFGENYTPEPTKTFLKKNNTSDFVQLTIGPEHTHDFTVYFPLPDSASVTHTIASQSDESVNCFIMIYSTRDDEISRNSVFTHNFLNNTVTWNPDQSGTLSVQNFNNNAQFGLLFYEYTEPGMAAVVLGGFVEKNPDGEWVALRITELNPVTVTPSAPEQTRERRTRRL